MIHDLPEPVTKWLETLSPREATRWLWLLRRCNTTKQVSDIYDYVQEALFQQKDLPSLYRRTSYVVRLTSILGTRDLASTTSIDLEAVLNAKEFRRYNPEALDQNNIRVINNAYLRREMQYSIQPNLRFQLTQTGMSKDDATRHVKCLMQAVPSIQLAPCNAHVKVKLTAKDMAAISNAVPKMPWTKPHTITMALWLALLGIHGPRVAGLLRSKRDAVQWQGGLACLVVPPGYLNKRTMTLFLDATTTNLLKAYLAHHPDPKLSSPLFWEFPQTQAPRPLTHLELSRHLKHLGTRAKLGHRLGLQSFRKYMATQVAVEGGSNADLQRHLGHSDVGRSTYRYIQVTRTELGQVIRGMTGNRTGQFSPCCRFRYAPGSDVCGHCGRRANQTKLNNDVHDPAQARRDLAGQLGLDSLGDLGIHVQ